MEILHINLVYLIIVLLLIVLSIYFKQLAMYIITLLASISLSIYLPIYVSIQILTVLVYTYVLYEHCSKFKNKINKINWSYILWRLFTIKVFLFNMYVFSDYSYCDGTVNKFLGETLINVGKKMSEPSITNITVSLDSSTYLKIAGACCLGICAGAAIVHGVNYIKNKNSVTVEERMDSLNLDILHLKNAAIALKKTTADDINTVHSSLSAQLCDYSKITNNQIEVLTKQNVAIMSTLQETTDQNNKMLQNTVKELMQTVNTIKIENENLTKAEQEQLTVLLKELQQASNLQDINSTIIGTQLDSPIISKFTYKKPIKIFNEGAARLSANNYKGIDDDEMEDPRELEQPKIIHSVINNKSQVYTVDTDKLGNIVFKPVANLTQNADTLSTFVGPVSKTIFYSTIVPYVTGKVLSLAANSSTLVAASSVLNVVNHMFGFSSTNSAAFERGRATREVSSTVLTNLRDFIAGINSKR